VELFTIYSIYRLEDWLRVDEVERDKAMTFGAVFGFVPKNEKLVPDLFSSSVDIIVEIEVLRFSSSTFLGGFTILVKRATETVVSFVKFLSIFSSSS
jgi:hypothetical protein